MYFYTGNSDLDKMLFFNLDIMRIIDKKETMVKIYFNDFSNSLHKEMLNILKDFVITKNKFSKYKQEIKNRQCRFKRRQRIEALNDAKRHFMKQNNICIDVRKLIYSFL